MPRNDWYIYCTPFTSPTARILAEKLGIKAGSRPKRSRMKFIRWGNVNPIPVRRVSQELQSCDSIKNCSNKLTAFKMMKESGVIVPKFYTSMQELQSNPHVFPLYSRKEYHTMGKDIVMVNNMTEAATQFRNGRYLVESIPCKKEYRIHVFDGEMISASKKYFRPQLWEELGSPRMKDLIRNNENGWGYYDIQDMENVPPKVKEQAIKAATSLSLLWGAIDIIHTPSNKAYVLEANSAPGLRDGRADLYAEKLIEKIERVEHA